MSSFHKIKPDFPGYRFSGLKDLPILSLLFFFILFNSTICFAKDIKFEATIDKREIPLGESLQLNLTFYGSQKIPPPGLPKINGFETRYLGPSTRISIVNGKVTSSITHLYTIIPLRTGKFQIGPFSISFKGKTLSASPITIEVVSGKITQSLPQRGDEPPEEKLKDRVFLTIETNKTKFYINEIVPLTIKLFVRNLSIRDIQYPQLDFKGFSMEEFSKPKQYHKTLNGENYEVIEFNSKIFGVKSGEFTLGPSRVSFNILMRKQGRRRGRPPFGNFFDDEFFESFFERRQIYPLDLKSNEVSITVLPLPQKGKPKGFNGAVGDFSFEMEAGPHEVKVGDPVTLKMIIKGKGNFDTVFSPVLQSQQDFKSYEPQVKQEDYTKTFEQVLMPETNTLNKIPEVRFSFFNPNKNAYQTITRGPIPIKVIQSKDSEIKIVDGTLLKINIPQKEILGRDIIYIKSSPGKLIKKGVYHYKKNGFWIIQVFPVAILAFVLALHRKREKLRTDLKYARGIQAPKKAKKGIDQARLLLKENKTGEFFDSIFATIREYFGNKFHLSTAGMTINTVEEVLKQNCIDEDVLNKIKDVFRDCDMARYAPSEFNNARMEEVFKNMEEVIDHLERKKAWKSAGEKQKSFVR